MPADHVDLFLRHMTVQRQSQTGATGVFRLRETGTHLHRKLPEDSLLVKRRVEIPLSLDSSLLERFIYLIAACFSLFGDEEDKIVAARGPIVRICLHPASRQ